MRAALATLAFALALTGPALAAEDGSWRIFSFPEAGFAVQLPAEPRPAKTSFRLGAGPEAPATVWTLERPGALYSVTVADLSGRGFARDQAIEAAVKDWSRGGEVTVDVVGRIDREFGRQLSLQRPDGGRAVASFFFVRDKLYLLEGRLGAERAGSSEATRFQQSLELTGLGAEAFRPENRPEGRLGGEGRRGQNGAGRGGRGPGFGPPPEAFAACVGKAAGARASFQAPRGEVAGTCQASPGGMAVRPDRPPPGGQGRGRPQDPPQD